MHKTEVYPTWWYTATGISVDVDGEAVRLPAIGTSASQAIKTFAQKGGFSATQYMALRDWFRKRSDQEIRATYQYYYDRWLWDSNGVFDKAAFILMEREIAQRKEDKKADTRFEDDIKEMMKQVTNAMDVPSGML